MATNASSNSTISTSPKVPKRKQPFFVRKSRSPPQRKDITTEALRIDPDTLERGFQEYEKIIGLMRSPSSSPVNDSDSKGSPINSPKSPVEESFLIDSSIFPDDDEEESTVLIDTEGIDFSESSEFCSHTNVIKEKGMTICEMCGIELYEEISHEQDWRFFGDSDSRNTADPSRCQYRKSPEKGIKKELERLGFPPDICQLADELYMMITDGEIKRSDLRKGIMFAVVFEAYKIKGKHRTPEELQTKFFGLERKGMSQGITYYRLRCVAKGTLITLSDGTCLPIETMTTNQEVWGFSADKNGLISTAQTDFINSGTKKCVELTFIDGRTLNCTPDHKLLTSLGEWKEAQDIVLGQDKIQAGVTGCWKKSEKFTYTFKVGSLELKMSDDLTSPDTKKAMALCRIMGYLITNGTHDNDSAELYFESVLDIQTASNDLNLLGWNRTIRTIRNQVYQLSLPTDLVTNIQELMPSQPNGYCNHPMIIPSFLFDTNTPLILVREFIASMFGGGGIAVSMNHDNFNHEIGLVDCKSKEHVENLVNNWTNLSKVLVTRFGIHCNIDLPIPTTTGKFNVSLIMKRIEDSLKFGENIGFRYCHHKILCMNAATSYWNYRNIIANQHKQLVKRTIELSASEFKSNADYLYPIFVTDALKMAIDELEETESVLLESIPYKNNKMNGMSPLAYLELIGAAEFFDEAHSYETLPTITLPVIGRKVIGSIPVYDITVTEPFSSFLASGIVCHNCPREYFNYDDISPKHFIPKYMQKFNARQEHVDKVILLYEKIKDSCSVLNRSNPQSTSKALVYYYLRRKGCLITPVRFGRIVALSEVIVIRLSLEISKILGTQKTLNLM